MPRSSATDGGNLHSDFPGVVHGPGSVGRGTWSDPHLGFNGPSLIDEASGVPARVVELLNAPLNSSDFIQIP